MKILGSKVEFETKKELEEIVKYTIERKKKAFFITLNTEMIVAAQGDVGFQRIINQATLAFADSVGLRIAYNFLSAKKKVPFKLVNLIKSGWGAMINTEPPVVSGVDFVDQVTSLSTQNDYKVLLVGGEEGRAEVAAQSLREIYPKLLIKGLYGGSRGLEDEEKIIGEINKEKAQILFLAFGHPHQEKWLARNLPKLDVNLAVGVGGAFDYISGEVRRAPKFVRNLGLEWLFRLVRQPWRIKRQISLLKFLYLLMKDS